MSFAKTIRDLRGSQTMEDFGRRINTKKTTISSWENGGIIPSATKLIEISKALQVSVDYLLGVSDVDNHEKVVIPKRLAVADLNDTKLDEMSTAILKYNPKKLAYTTSMTNVMAIVKSPAAFRKMYLNPLLRLMMQSARKPNIIADVDSKETIDKLVELSRQNDYDLKIVDSQVAEHDKSFHWNMLGFLRSQPEAVVMQVFKNFVSANTADDTTGYWKLVFTHYLTLQFRDYCEYVEPTTNMSFALFYDFVDGNPLDSQAIEKSAILHDLAASTEMKSVLYQSIMAILRKYRDSDLVDAMDKYSTSTLPSLTKPTVLIFRFGDDSSIFEAYATIIKDLLLRNVMQDRDARPAEWFMDLNVHDFNYETAMAIGIGRKQFFTLITNKDVATRENANVLFANAHVIVNQDPNDTRLRELLVKFSDMNTIVSRQNLSLSDVMAVPYTLTSDTVYPFTTDYTLISECLNIKDDVVPDKAPSDVDDQTGLTPEQVKDINHITELVRDFLVKAATNKK